MHARSIRFFAVVINFIIWTGVGYMGWGVDGSWSLSQLRGSIPATLIRGGREGRREGRGEFKREKGGKEEVSKCGRKGV
jgi:hypothetical protein